MNFKFLLNLVCSTALITLIVNNTFGQARPKPKLKNYDTGVNYNNSKVKPGEAKVTFDKNQKIPVFIAPGVSKVVVKNTTTKQTETFVVGKDKISLKRESVFDITFNCYNYDGIKSVTASGGYNDGLPGQLMLQQSTVSGDKDEKGNYKASFSHTFSCNTYSDKPNYKYQTGSFLINIENTKGEKSFHKIEFTLY